MASNKSHLSRRALLKGIGAGVMGVAFGGEMLGLAGSDTFDGEGGGDSQRHQEPGKRLLYKKVTEPARVSLVKGNDRREIVYQSLKMIEDEVLSSIGGKKILIKPNMVNVSTPLCATDVDAIRAILDFLKPHYKSEITIGESSAGRISSFEGFKNYGYLALEKEYNVKLVDLNRTAYQYRYVFGNENQPLAIRIISAFLDPDIYIISASRMKTHDRVLVTLALKNVIMGSPLNDYKQNDKHLVHTGQRAVNTLCHYNMFHLAQEVYPDLAVIDGFVGMEGNGPMRGTPFDSRVAIASQDALAADTTATKVMGFDPKRILYLTAMTQAGMGQGEMEKINVLGSSLNECLYHFKPQRRMAELYDL